MKRLALSIILSLGCCGLLFAEPTAEEVISASIKSETAGKFDEAMDILKKGKKQVNPGLFAQRSGWLYFLKGDFNNSLKEYTNALKVNPQDWDSVAGKVVALSNLKKWADMEKAAADLLKFAPDNYIGNFHMGLMLMAKKQWAMAEGFFKRFPNDGVSVANYGACRLEQGDKAGAKAAFTQALVLIPGLKSAQEGLAKCGK